MSRRSRPLQLAKCVESMAEMVGEQTYHLAIVGLNVVKTESAMAAFLDLFAVHIAPRLREGATVALRNVSAVHRAGASRPAPRRPP